MLPRGVWGPAWVGERSHHRNEVSCDRKPGECYPEVFWALCGLEIQKEAMTKTTFVVTGNPQNIMQVAAEGVWGPVWVGGSERSYD